MEQIHFVLVKDNEEEDETKRKKDRPEIQRKENEFNDLTFELL